MPRSARRAKRHNPAANIGVSAEGATLYVTLQPCVICAKMSINAGIKKIVYKGTSADPLSLDMLSEAGVELIVMEG